MYKQNIYRGVSSGKDVFELILCGAKAVQVGTCHWTEGPSCFDRISNELEAIMKKKGYKSIQDFHGKLKPYTKSSSGAKSKEVVSQSKMDPSDEIKELKATLQTYKYLFFIIVGVLLAILFSFTQWVQKYCPNKHL